MDCKHCDKHIPADKFRMHEMQCVRINTRCPHCQCVVMKAELQQHIDDTHTVKPEPIVEPVVKARLPVFKAPEESKEPFDEEEANR